MRGRSILGGWASAQRSGDISRPLIRPSGTFSRKGRRGDPARLRGREARPSSTMLRMVPLPPFHGGGSAPPRNPPMRPAPPALVAALAAARAAHDAPLLMADCYTLTLRSGTVLDAHQRRRARHAGRHHLPRQLAADRRSRLQVRDRTRRRRAAGHPGRAAHRHDRRGAGADGNPSRRARRLHPAPRARVPDELGRATARLDRAVPGPGHERRRRRAHQRPR